MVRVNSIKENPKCVASIVVRARKGAKPQGTSMKIGNKTHKILGILHRPSTGNTETSNYGCSEDC